MFRIAPLALVALIAAAVYVTTRHRHQHPLTPTGPTTSIRPPIPPEMVRPMVPPRAGMYRDASGHGTAAPVPRARPELADALSAWRDAGIITQEQAERIESFEREAAVPPAVEPQAPPRRVPFVAEALGYLGGILGIVGLVLLIARYWPDMAAGGRLALGAGGTLVFGVGGYLVREGTEPALTRLRWFLWLLSSAAGALLAGVFVHQVIDTESAQSIVLGGAVMVAVQNAIFWAWRERPIQQLLALGGLVTATALGVAQFASDGPMGLCVMAVGAPLLVMACRSLTPTPPVTAAVGAGATIVGAAMTIGDWVSPGQLLFVTTAAAVMAIAAWPRWDITTDVRVVLTVIAGMCLTIAVPSTVGHFAAKAGVATGLVVWTVGGLLVITGSRRWTRAPLALEIVGGLAIVGGAAVTGAQSVAFATLFGLATAIGLIGLGTVPGRVLMSLFGSLGLLVNVPWSILHFFPGEGKAPLLILASGAVIVAVAVWLARMGGRLRRELRG